MGICPGPFILKGHSINNFFFLLCVSIVSLLLYMQISIEMKGTHLQACIKGSDKIFIELFKC